MIFTETPLKGAFLVEPERHEDERGLFARTWCEREATAQGLNPRIVQCNISFNAWKGGLRGLHYQLPPHTEAKLVRCTRGMAHDVIIDLRPDSPSFTRHWSVVLTAESRAALYVPEGFAHGFQALEDGTELFYQMSAFHAPEAAGGVRWNDPLFGIRWPLVVTTISDRDRHFRDFVPPGPFARP